MATSIEKLTISLPRKLIAFADELAKERNTTRSKVVSSCLEELAQKRLHAEMEAGYKAMAKEHSEFATLSSQAAKEVLPPW